MVVKRFAFLSLKAAPACVSRIITEMAVIDVTPEGLMVQELAEGVSFDDVREPSARGLRGIQMAAHDFLLLLSTRADLPQRELVLDLFVSSCQAQTAQVQAATSAKLIKSPTIGPML